MALAPAAPVAAQQSAEARADTARVREVDLEADSLSWRTVDGEQIAELVGNVRLRQEQTHLWSDRATQFRRRDEILFVGDVLIVEDGDSLRADTVLYDKQRKTGRARGSVHLTDGDVVVVAPSGTYYTREKRAVFDDGVTLVDSVNVLRSRAGEYWSDEKRAEFYGDVRLDEDRTHLEADSVTYFRETEISLARGAVVIERLGDDEETDGEPAASADSTLRTLLYGQRAYNDNRAGYSRITGQPLLVQLRRDSVDAPVDTLLIRARRLEASRIDSLQRLVAVDAVRIWQRDLAATADSVVYDRLSLEGEEPARETARLYRNPVAWFEQTQVIGDSMRVESRGGAVDTLFVRNDAFVAQRDTTLERIQQIRGRDLTAVFADDSLRTLVIGPNAEAVYFRADDDGRLAGATQMSSDRIRFDFGEGGELRRIAAVGGVESTYYGAGLIPDPLELEGFDWRPEQRPTHAGLLRDVHVPPPQVRPEIIPAFPVLPPVALQEVDGAPDGPPPPR